MNTYDYPLIVEPLPAEEGGGFMARAPDLPGCMSDGETPAEAVINVQDAIMVWIDDAVEHKRPVPAPSRALNLAAA